MLIDTLLYKADTIARSIDRKSGQSELLNKQILAATSEIGAYKGKLALYEDVQALLLTASATSRAQVTSTIEGLVTYALRAIKGEEYTFIIQSKTTAGQHSVDFLIRTPDGNTLDIVNQSGGGIGDIVSVAMRISILQMYDATGGPILLDEDFKFLSRDNIRSVVEFLRTIISKTGRQIILVTHIPDFADYADNIIEVTSAGDYSTISTYNRKEMELP